MRELVALDDVVADEELGPNGGLVRCMELLLDNLDWLEEQLGQYYDDYLIIDCPGPWPCRVKATILHSAVGYMRAWATLRAFWPAVAQAKLSCIRTSRS